MPYVGEIRMFAGNFAPINWMFCQGQTLSVATYPSLYSLIGTTYGGTAGVSFKLPNLTSRIPIHMGTLPDGTSYSLGAAGGTEKVTLTVPQLPYHTHTMMATTENSTQVPGGKVLASAASLGYYPALDVPAAMAASAIGINTGGGASHDNVQPYLCINFIISITGT